MYKQPFIIKLTVGFALLVFLGCNRQCCCNCTNPPVLIPDVVSRPPGCVPPNTLLLGVEMIKQQSFQWCWAASGEMCMEFLRPGSTMCQCDQANDYFCRTPFPDGNNCCTGITSCRGFFYVESGCDSPQWPDLKLYQFTSTPTSNAPLSFNDLQTELSCFKKPVMFSWHLLVNGVPEKAHIMVASGYLIDTNGVPWVYINDPAKGSRLILYDEYVSGNDHTHYNDFYDIKTVATHG